MVFILNHKGLPFAHKTFIYIITIQRLGMTMVVNHIIGRWKWFHGYTSNSDLLLVDRNGAEALALSFY